MKLPKYEEKKFNFMMERNVEVIFRFNSYGKITLSIIIHFVLTRWHWQMFLVSQFQSNRVDITFFRQFNIKEIKKIRYIYIYILTTACRC